MTERWMYRGTKSDPFRVIIDMDDTLTELSAPWVLYLNKKYGLSVDPSTITWDIHDSFPSLTYDQVYEVLHERELWQTVIPKEGAISSLQNLVDKDYLETIIVTASDYKTIEYKFEDVLFKYFPFFPKENIVVTSNKSLVSGDIFIDDAYHNHVAWWGSNYVDISDFDKRLQSTLFGSGNNRQFSHNPHKKLSIMPDAPHNKSVLVNPLQIYRVDGWEQTNEILDMVLEDVFCK